jgi:hypothetical protein
VKGTPENEELEREVDRLLADLEAKWNGEGVVKLCAALLAAAWATRVEPEGDKMLEGVFNVIRTTIREMREEPNEGGTHTH